ncbi:MAG TPA: T9SS type A sorting domain-containing protein [Flavobacteriales bacterium]|nr:T9SS type A sorting domain-containing protein [Flavobacteriales bacterium]HMR28275.1 T9SS type A sorting domain-containing protein [Flavobacteriales bacterium]
MSLHSRRPLLGLALFLGPFCTAQWSQTNTGITDLSQGAQVLGASSTQLFAKAGSTLYRSADNGTTWSVATNPVALNPTESGFAVGGRYFAGLNASTDCIYYTTDNGDTWNTVAGAPQATVVRGFLANGTHVFAYASTGGVFRSPLPGDAWTTVNTGLYNTNVIGMLLVGNDLYANTIGGGVFISTDGGSTWDDSNTGISPSDLNGENLWLMDGDLFYTAQGGGKYTSTDGGTTWTAWAGLPQFGLGLLEVKRYGTNLYMETRHFAGGGLRDSVYLSTDEGASWTNITGNLSADDLNGSGIVENDGCVFIGYNLISPGQGIYRRCGSTGLSEESAQAVSVFPNPVEGVIAVVVPQQAIGSPYRVVDITGAEVLRGRIRGAQVELDLSALAAGTYVLRVEGGAMAPVRVVKR